MSELFFNKLNESDWKCCITEVGSGVNFINDLSSSEGASNTLYSAHCPYGSSTFDGRLVSKQCAVYYAKLNQINCYAKHGRKSFGLGITAACYKDRLANVWMAININDKMFTLHMCPSMNDKVSLGKEISLVAQKFVSSVLFQTDAVKVILGQFSWKNKHTVDVIDGPGISMEDKITLHLESGIPLVFHNNTLHRVTDYLRKYNKIYPGSFNPPHERHAHGPRNSTKI